MQEWSQAKAWIMPFYSREERDKVGFEVLTAVVMKSSLFCAVTPCSPFKCNTCFGGTCHLHLQGQRISQVGNQHEAGSKPFQQTTHIVISWKTELFSMIQVYSDLHVWFVHFHTELYAVVIILYSPYICAVSHMLLVLLLRKAQRKTELHEELYMCFIFPVKHSNIPNNLLTFHCA
jgi:hypothetical protein